MLEPEGNFPAEAEERCGPLPPGVVPIADLTSAWAMTKVPVDDVDLSFRAATTTLVLQGLLFCNLLAWEAITGRLSALKLRWQQQAQVIPAKEAGHA